MHDARREAAGRFPEGAGGRGRATRADGGARASRAAQFMPFAALRGYYELVSQQEREVEPRHELTEDEALELSATMARVRRGQIVRAVYYDRDAYVSITGCVAHVDLVGRTLGVIRETIPFDDLRELEIVEE